MSRPIKLIIDDLAEAAESVYESRRRVDSKRNELDSAEYFLQQYEETYGSLIKELEQATK